MIEKIMPDEAITRLNEMHLMEAEVQRLSLRLIDLAALRDYLTYAGHDADETISEFMSRRDTLLNKLSNYRREPFAVDSPLAAAGSLDLSINPHLFDRFDLCGGFLGWKQQPTPLMTNGISETPGVPGTSGEIVTAGLYQGGAGYGGLLSDTGQHKPGQEKFWIRNWRCLVTLPSAPDRGTYHYRFDVSSIANVYHAPVMSGGLWVFVTVGTTGNVNTPITNWSTVGWPVLVTLPAAPPLYYAGDVPVSGKIPVGKGRTAAVGLIFGVIVSVNHGYVQFLWGNFGTRRALPPGTTHNHEDYGRIEYRFCPEPVLALEKQLRDHFNS